MVALHFDFEIRSIDDDETRLRTWYIKLVSLQFIDNAARYLYRYL